MPLVRLFLGLWDYRSSVGAHRVGKESRSESNVGANGKDKRKRVVCIY